MMPADREPFDEQQQPPIESQVEPSFDGSAMASLRPTFPGDLFLEKQQDVRELYLHFYTLMTGKEIQENPKTGNLEWVAVDKRPLTTDEGAMRIINEYKALVNRNTLNSNYNEKRIKYVTSYVAGRISRLIYGHYHEILHPARIKNPNDFTIVMDAIVTFVLVSTEAVMRRAINGTDLTTSRQRGFVNIHEEKGRQQRQGFFSRMFNRGE